MHNQPQPLVKNWDLLFKGRKFSVSKFYLYLVFEDVWQKKKPNLCGFSSMKILLHGSFPWLGNNSQELSLRSQVQRSTSSSPHLFSSCQEEILTLAYLTAVATSSELALFHTFPHMLLPPSIAHCLLWLELLFSCSHSSLRVTSWLHLVKRCIAWTSSCLFCTLA